MNQNFLSFFVWQERRKRNFNSKKSCQTESESNFLINLTKSNSLESIPSQMLRKEIHYTLLEPWNRLKCAWIKKKNRKTKETKVRVRVCVCGMGYRHIVVQIISFLLMMSFPEISLCSYLRFTALHTYIITLIMTQESIYYLINPHGLEIKAS